MKKLFKNSLKGFLTGCTLFATGIGTNAQMPKWALLPNYYDMSSAAPGPAVSLPGAASHNIIGAAHYNESDSLVFSVNDNGDTAGPYRVCNASGATLGYLPDYRVPYDASEFSLASSAKLTYPNVMIVPSPGECNKYYILYNLRGWITLGLFYVKIDLTGGSMTIDPSTLEPAVAGTDPATHRNPKSLKGIAFAVSKQIDAAQNRYLFSRGGFNIVRYKITSSGIGSETIIAEDPPGSHRVSTFEMELSPDQKYLAFTYERRDDGIKKLYQIPLSDYMLDPDGYITNKTLPTDANLGGIEYDATSTNLYLTGDNKIHRIKAATAHHFMTFFSTASATGSAGQMELGKSGKIYFTNKTTEKLSYFTPSAGAVTVTELPISMSSFTGSFSTSEHEIDFRYWLPRQIDGENYATSAASSPDFKINNNVVSTSVSSALNVYRCGAITLNNISVGAIQYELTVQSADASGNPITSGTYLNYNSGWRTSPPTNLKSLPATPVNNTWLAASGHTGYYKISLRTKNACGKIAAPRIGYIKLNETPPSVIMSFSISKSATAGMCNTKSIGSACQTDRNDGVYNLGTSDGTFLHTNIISVQRKIQEVNCSTGAVVSTVYEETTPVMTSSSDPINDLSLNALVGGAIPYFQDKSGRCYKFTMIASNACTSVSDWSYFKVATPFTSEVKGKTTLPLASPRVLVYPNPVIGQLDFQFDVTETQTASIELTDIQGKRVYYSGNINCEEGQNSHSIDMSKLAQGIYIYRLTTNDGLSIGRISKID